MEKMTYATAVANAINALSQYNEYDETVKRLQDLSASLEKRTASKKPSKAQVENAQFAETVYSVIDECGAPMKCGEIAKALDVSGQKVSGALIKLVKAGRVEKTVDKGVSWFSVSWPNVD